MDKKKIIGIVGAILAVVLIVFFFVFFIQKPVAKNSVGSNLAKNESDEVRKMLEVNRAAVDNAGVIGELPLLSEKDRLDGDFKAKVKIIVYEDLADNFSGKFDETITEIKNKFGNSVVLAYRYFIFKGDDVGLKSAEAAECAGDQGKFMEMRKLLLDKSKNEDLRLTEFGSYAKSLGLDEAKFNKCLDAEKYKESIEKSVENIRNTVVFGVPTIYVGDEVITGARLFKDSVNGNKEKVEGMESVINRHLK
jgi:protein-disulfide isomerase